MGVSVIESDLRLDTPVHVGDTQVLRVGIRMEPE